MMPDGSEFTWQRWATAALGIAAMIAGGFMTHTPAGGPLIASGSALTGLAIPWPKRRRRSTDATSLPPPSIG